MLMSHKELTSLIQLNSLRQVVAQKCFINTKPFWGYLLLSDAHSARSRKTFKKKSNHTFFQNSLFIKKLVNFKLRSPNSEFV